MHTRKGTSSLIMKFSRFRVMDDLAVTQSVDCGVWYHRPDSASTLFRDKLFMVLSAATRGMAAMHSHRLHIGYRGVSGFSYAERKIFF